MTQRSLHEVLADVVDAGHRYPALRSHIDHALYDGDRLRRGVYEMETRHSHQSGSLLELHTSLMFPSTWLLQFAAAVSCGFIPDGPLPASDASGA